MLYAITVPSNVGARDCSLPPSESKTNILQAEHKAVHKAQSNFLSNFLTPKVVSEPHPETGVYNPFPTFSYTGTLRPVYPLSEQRKVPKSIPHPDYWKDGIPHSENTYPGRNKIDILDKEAQEAMRKVCRFGREVLDIAGAAVKPGVTTDYLDQLVHEASIEREVRIPAWGRQHRKLTNIVLPISPQLWPFPKICLHISQRSHLSRNSGSICPSRW